VLVKRKRVRRGGAVKPGDLYLFNFAVAISFSEELGSDTNGSAVCISVFLALLTLCTFNNRVAVSPHI
jgi:hypothetical protein